VLDLPHWLTHSRVHYCLAERSAEPMKKIHKAYISTAALVASLVLAQVGIIDLVAKGYEMMAYAMIAVYGLPLLFNSKRLLFK
jgi:uncharacterized membrane protein YkvI